MPQQPRSSQQGQGQRQPQRALVARPEQTPQQVALVAVTREIDQRLSIIEASSAAGIRPDRLKLVALTAFTRNPDLLKCTPVSLARAIVEAGQLGLEPTGLLGGAYLVPRGNEATLLVGYKGLVNLAKRSGEVSRVEARIVREKDAFAYAYGLNARLEHQPYSGLEDPGKLTHAYAIIHYRDGSSQFEVMSVAEIEAIRARSASPQRGPWVSDYFEMAKKTVLRRALKLAPLSIEVAERLDAVDPEVAFDLPAAAAGKRDATKALRSRLQTALTAEYGGGEEVEGQSREIPGDGQAASGSPASGGDGSTGSGTSVDQAGASAGVGTAPAGAPAAACGVIHEGLGVGPCVLSAGHVDGPWRDRSGAERPAQREHEDNGGVKWTMPASNPNGGAR